MTAKTTKLIKNEAQICASASVFEAMQQEISEIKITNAELKKDVGYIKEKIGTFEQKVDAFILSADQCYAKKSIESDVKALKAKIDDQASRNDDRKWQIITMGVVIFIGIVLAALNLT